MNIAKYRNLLHPYTELKYHFVNSKIIVYRNGEFIKNEDSTSSGIFVRAYRNGVWGVASSPVWGDDLVPSLLKAAEYNADFLGSRRNQKIDIFTKDNSKEIIFDLNDNKNQLSQESKIESILKIYKYLKEKYTFIESVTIATEDILERKEVSTSVGSYSMQNIPKFLLTVVISLKNHSTNEYFSLSENFFSENGSGSLLMNTEILFKKLDSLVEHLRKKSEGIAPNGGTFDVILGGSLASIIVHETIGHMVEADNVLKVPQLSSMLNTIVANRCVTVVDFAHTVLGRRCIEPVYVDDEGIEADDVCIIDKGRLQNFLHNRETSAFMGNLPTGNARSESFRSSPLIRMRNTCIMPGNNALKDMISTIENGYFLLDGLNGETNLNGEFVATVRLGYEIRNGKLGNAIRDTAISGIATDLLKSITMVSDDFTSFAGMCGKKNQSIGVSYGSPSIKTRVKIGG